MGVLTVDAGVELVADPTRVVAGLFLPGESTPGGSRTEAVLQRVVAASDAEIAASADLIRQRFADRHPDLPRLLRTNASIVGLRGGTGVDGDRALVLGATFTAEQSLEGAALCNPSVVPHPDQSGLAAGEQRTVLSLRSIAESHTSSIQFCEAIIGPGRSWRFLPRQAHPVVAEHGDAEWGRDHLRRALEHDGRTDELVRMVCQSLPVRFDAGAVEQVVGGLRIELLHQPAAHEQVDAIRVLVASAYRAEFSVDSALSQRVLLPAADGERRGMEDARFVSFTDGGRTEYRGTYTAYDGRSISSRLLSTTDFRTFRVDRLTGPAALTKGMALFPRRVGGMHLALGRGDGESNSLSRSADGLDWSGERVIHRPHELWEVVQTGNCGSPIETEAGWLVLTHGVGPMRAYGIGAILLDLDDPSRLAGVLPGPLLEPDPSDRDGYVPNVVYSCGGIVHDGILWIPHGVADQRIRVASVPVADLLAAMREV